MIPSIYIWNRESSIFPGNFLSKVIDEYDSCNRGSSVIKKFTLDTKRDRYLNEEFKKEYFEFLEVRKEHLTVSIFILETLVVAKNREGEGLRRTLTAIVDLAKLKFNYTKHAILVVGVFSSAQDGSNGRFGKFNLKIQKILLELQRQPFPSYWMCLYDSPGVAPPQEGNPLTKAAVRALANRLVVFAYKIAQTLPRIQRIRLGPYDGIEKLCIEKATKENIDRIIENETENQERCRSMKDKAFLEVEKIRREGFGDVLE